MKYDFIQVNKIILDYSKYMKEVLLLKNYLKHRITELLLEEGFLIEEEQNDTYDCLKLRFYHKGKDLEIKIITGKRMTQKFI